MEKKNYTRPIMGFERFVPNEYCNVCFSLHCLVAAGDSRYAGDHSRYFPNEQAYLEKGGSEYSVHGKYTLGVNAGHGCGWDDNQVIRISDSGAISVMEINTPDAIEQDELPASFVNPTNLTLDYLKANPGTIIEWNTTGSIGGRTYTYRHKGTAILNDTTKGPSHS